MTRPGDAGECDPHDTGEGFEPELEDDTCIADDSIECDCSSCLGASYRWECEQGWHEREDQEPHVDEEYRP